MSLRNLDFLTNGLIHLFAPLVRSRGALMFKPVVLQDNTERSVFAQSAIAMILFLLLVALL
ncbi:MAG: hypothetical protein B0A82_12405 [Alkalinema sp. CACIAM 70d]|nr:MAG: hypothetical protein B0A82_12405 [Alkalinema sp. CACIAM 70d]